MCSKVWSRRISSWDRDVSKLLSEICMHGWKRIKKKWTRLLSKWLILIFIQIRITIRMEKRAQREEKSSATFKLISRISKKFIRRVNSIDTNISNSIKLFQRTTQSSNYRISITDYVVLDERDTRSTFYRSVSSAKRKIWKNATNPVIIPFFFCLVFHSCMKKKRKKKKKILTALPLCPFSRTVFLFLSWTLTDICPRDENKLSKSIERKINFFFNRFLSPLFKKKKENCTL